MGGSGDCGCGATGAQPCTCEHPATPPPDGGAPARPAFVRPQSPAAAPGIPQPLTRFDIFEDSRRSGYPVAFPEDPARSPDPPARGPVPALLEPAAHPTADGRPVVEPRFDAPMPGAVPGPLAPDGTPLDIERFFNVASPEGVAVPFDLAWPGDMPVDLPGAPAHEPPAAAPDRDAVQPPEYLSRVGGPEEAALLDAPPVDEPRVIDRPPPPGPPGFASPDEPRGNEPRAPGQDACTEHAFYVFPPAEEFLFTPAPPDARGGGGGGGDEPPVLFSGMVSAVYVDPCPCVCECVHSSMAVRVFVLAARLLGSLFDLFGRDTRSLLGVSATPATIVSTPDGFVEQVRDLLTRRDSVVYGTPMTVAPGSVTPSDGLTGTFAVRAPAPLAPQRLLWPELDGTLAAETRVVAPVGPGPGLPGIGSHALVPASGVTLRAAPGSLPAGIAPAGDGFGGFVGGVS